MHVFLCAEKGATAIEYALIAGLVVLVVIAGISTLGQSVSDVLYNKIALILQQ